MASNHPSVLTAPASSLPGSAGIFDVPKKITVLRLRWLVVIICSYLLVTSHGTWLPPSMVNAFILFYVLTNIALYKVDEAVFDSAYFYSPLVIFDTLFVTASLVISGQVGTDFYLAYFLVVILCTIWQDFRGLITVAVLATLLYGYFLWETAERPDPSVYLRIPFLFVISLFYGYFAQVVRAEKTLKEQAEQEAQDMAMIQSLSQSLPSSLDYRQILETLGDKINNVVRAARFYIFTLDEKNESSPAIMYTQDRGREFGTKEVNLKEFPIVQECLLRRGPVIQQNVFPRLFRPEETPGVRSQESSFPMAMSVPIAFRGEILGVILLGFNEADRSLTSREIQFCQIVAFAAAIALSNAKKYEELQAEAKRRQIIAEDLAEANRLKSEYLANTSHELRTPVATILGYADLLMEGACGKLTGEQKKTIQRLTDNARELLGLVDVLLDYSKIERGEKGVVTRQRDIRQLIEELQRDLAPLENKKSFKVRYEIENGISTLDTDWAKLKSVLYNVLNNAIKFTDQGEVKMAVARKSDGEVSFMISDTGIGISKDQIPLIFDKFRQLDGSSTRRFQGTGLGLTVSRNLVELLGGRIEVISEVGKGSIFTVTIPVSSQ